MRKKQNKKENSERWLLTYSDLITLLMALFVILYASSNVDKEKYQQISTSLHQAFNMNDSGNVGVIEGNPATGDPDKEEIENNEITEEQKLNSIKVQIDKLISEAGLEGSVSTKSEERGLVISFSDTILFDSAKAIVKDDHKKQLIDISKVLNKVDNDIIIEGHTDNVAIKNDLYDSNWELSSARAVNVLKTFANECQVSSNRLSTRAYGEYKPVTTNDTEEGRAKNRRVDILIVNNKFNGIEVTNK
ncbi:flagellar motor protein MotB [Clostridium sp. SHJSY1]|uniref:flagellar motor protein MotB n=1 Tax=Clostridium sp. SHJSY1 TaxID=2942483 RepID=UPI0028746457|nr:flagellar motor protein MotB [Clostridium sp. SHJSY1]MDS0528539.1 flagellar motor protein MotB [Clostridium sp. SHJSY1]